MAISEDMPAVEVEITVDGYVLQKYQDDDLEEMPSTITRYIEAVTGQNFVIAIKAPETCEFVGSSISFQISTDGKFADNPTVDVNDYALFGTRECEGVYSPDGKLRRFRFAALDTVPEDQLVVGQKSTVSDLAALKSMLLFPRTPDPEPLHERPVENMSIEDIRELQRRLREAEALSRGTPDRRVKREREEREDTTRRRRRARPSADVMYLELEDDGDFRARSETLAPQERVVIELD